MNMGRRCFAPGNESGAALVIALIMMVLISLIGIAANSTSLFEIRLAGNARGSTSAFFAAESGIHAVSANIQNFNLDERYVEDVYDPFTVTNNPNPARSKVRIHHDPVRHGAPRGLGFSASGNFDFEHFLIESTGTDQMEISRWKSLYTVEEKVVRLMPTIQGGY
jgi:hypothetical protein